MAGPIYKVFLMKNKNSFYKLPQNEQQELSRKGEDALKSVGGERVVMCASMWSSENWLGFGVEKFPDIEAVQKHSQALFELNWFNYFESVSYLGTELPEM